VVVVEDRDVASRLSAQSEGGLRFVSLEAEVWERGRVRAGSTRSLAGLLHREMELRELSGRLAEQRLTIEGHQRELEGLEERRGVEAERRSRAQSELEARREALETLMRELEGAERERQWAHREAEERRLECQSLDSEHAALGRAAAEAERELAEFQSRLEAARVRVADSDGELRALEARRDEAATAAQSGRETLLSLSREAGELEA